MLQNDVQVKHLITLNTFCGLSSVKAGDNNRDGLDSQHDCGSQRVLVFPSGNEQCWTQVEEKTEYERS